MSDNQLQVIAKENGLEENQIQGLLSRFGESFQTATKAVEWSKTVVVTDESQIAVMKQAREARLKLKNVRVEVEHTRKDLKEQSLREGKAIDGMANIIKAMIIPAEEHLEKQEKFAENLANERKARVSAERLVKLMDYTDTPDMYSYAGMEQDVFDKLIADLKTAKEAKLAAEKQAEADRIAAEKAAAAEQERIRKENATLKAEAEAREAALAKERAQVEAEKKAAEETARKDREAIEAKLEVERKAREAAEKEKQDAENKRLQAEAAEAKARTDALLAPDKEKLLALADTLERIELPSLASHEAGKVLDETKDFLSRITKNLRSKAGEL